MVSNITTLFPHQANIYKQRLNLEPHIQWYFGLELIRLIVGRELLILVKEEQWKIYLY